MALSIPLPYLEAADDADIATYLTILTARNS